jgi:hypothetical protein
MGGGAYAFMRREFSTERGSQVCSARPLSMPSRAVPVDLLNVEAAPASATGGVQQQVNGV